ncbi:hypothetical protein PIIN_03235 [Serendipita indica DSM 11827]|uniref:C2H2-type domain-containing protein n=1 Tax=Serendipita indica (strain DSM 11827) TaxID=1109443 RepID=G4TDD4_SERID|nr:hypothetical protein PIIN_03235 [Serendipita indica DSM 11827]
MQSFASLHVQKAMSSNQYVYPHHTASNQQRNTSNSPPTAQHGFPVTAASHPQYTTAVPGYAYPIAQNQPTSYHTAPAFMQSLEGTSATSAYNLHPGYNSQVPTQYVAEHGYVVPSQTQDWEGYVEGLGMHNASSGAFHAGALAPQLGTAVPPGWRPTQVSSHSATPQMYANAPNPATGYDSQAPVTISLTTPGGSPLTSSGNACDKCPATFQRMTDLKRHIRSVHTNETPYKCLGCDEGFVRSDARLRHWRETPSCQQLHEQRRG